MSKGVAVINRIIFFILSLLVVFYISPTTFADNENKAGVIFVGYDNGDDFKEAPEKIVRIAKNIFQIQKELLINYGTVHLVSFRPAVILVRLAISAIKAGYQRVDCFCFDKSKR